MSSISDACLQEVVGIAKNNENTNYRDFRSAISFPETNANQHNSGMKRTAHPEPTKVFLNLSPEMAHSSPPACPFCSSRTYRLLVKMQSAKCI